jgi:predicted PolB exonuclease-like 3'-5' exonuclease
MAEKPVTYLILDIETIPDRTLFAPPEPSPGNERERAFPPLYACRPVVIGVMWLDENLHLKRFGTIGEGKDEAGMLSDFADFVGARQPHLVTWNGRGFDLPVLLLRSLRHGLSWPWYYQGRDYRYRYSEQGHLDLCDFLSDHGAARMTSLDGASRLIGLPGKDGVDGSQVEGLFNAGQIEALRRYCLHDVTQTAFLFLRYRLLVGQIDRATYQRAAEAVLAAAAADPRLTRLAEHVDRERLLLDPSGAPPRP